MLDVVALFVHRPSRGFANAVDNLRLAMTKEPWSTPPADRDAAIVRREAVPRTTLDKYDMMMAMPTMMSILEIAIQSVVIVRANTVNHSLIDEGNNSNIDGRCFCFNLIFLVV
jgi:hypothetical protein